MRPDPRADRLPSVVPGVYGGPRPVEPVLALGGAADIVLAVAVFAMLAGLMR